MTATKQHDNLNEPASICDFRISLSPSWKAEVDEKIIDIRVLLHYPADSKRRSRAILTDDDGHNIQDGDSGRSLVGFANMRRDPPPGSLDKSLLISDVIVLRVR